MDYWSDYITIAWDTPKSDGGSPITGFVVEKRDASRQMWIKAGTVRPDITTFKIGNLFEGVDYHFRVFAENKAGLSVTAVETEKSITAKMPFGKYDAHNMKDSLALGHKAKESTLVVVRYVVGRPL